MSLAAAESVRFVLLLMVFGLDRRGFIYECVCGIDPDL